MKYSASVVLSLLLLLCVGLSQASISVQAAPTAIDDRCMCGRHYEPVCGSDANTYANNCLFKCARDELARSGRSLTLVRAGTC